jgi:tetratricopeptide (TPR) repeat protein
MLSGDAEAAAERLRHACDEAAEREQTNILSTFAPLRGRALCSLGRYREAEALAEQGRELGAEEDLITQALWRQTAALVTAHRGNHAEAERLAREAGAILENTDALASQGDAFYDLAEVLAAADRRQEASAALRQALALYERKQIIPLARRTRERLATLEQRSGMSAAGGVSPPPIS